jgi:hypothetical protein
MTRPLLVAALAIVAAQPRARAASQPIERFAIVIGSNQGGAGRSPLRYAQADAQSMWRVLGQLGGMQAPDSVLLLDPQRRAVLDSLDRLAHSQASRKRRELIVYYSGHSDDQGLLLGSERLGYDELRAGVTRIRADVSIVILDSCSAGSFARRKGGTTRPPFLSDESVDVHGYAFLASSSDREAAQESDRIGGSFFTHYLLSGLRGAADVSGDHRVTLNEAYNFAFNETLAGTEKTLGGAQHPAYDIQLVGTGDVVMTDLHDTSAVLTLPRELSGRLYVHDGAGALVAELGKQEGRTVDLGLDPGRYRVIVDRGGKLSETTIALVAARKNTLDPAALASVAPELTVARGAAPLVSVPVNVAIVDPVSVNHMMPGRTHNTLSLNLGGSYADQLDGFAMGVGWNAVGERASGFLMAAGANVVGDRMRGFLMAGGANVVRDRFDGMAMAGGANTAGRMYGLQLAVVNTADEVHGLQLGMVNVARTVRGAQLGVINVATESDASYGVLSIIRHGTHSFETWASDITPWSAALKLGGSRIYAVLGGGLGFYGEGRWSTVAGIGAHLHRGERFYLDLDLLHNELHVAQDDATRAQVEEARVELGFRVAEAFALFVTPGLHFGTNGYYHESSSQLSALEHTWQSGSHTYRLGPSIGIGLRVF